MKVIIARHGETDWNREKRIQGWTDIPLNENGINQALELAEQLKNQGIKKVFCSDLSRSYQTAKIVAEKLNLPITIDKRLREVHRGELDGFIVDIAKLKYPEFFKKWQQDPYNAKPPGKESESPAMAEKRIKSFIEDWKPCLDRSLIVGHRVTNIVLYRVLKGVKITKDLFFELFIENGSFFEVEVP